MKRDEPIVRPEDILPALLAMAAEKRNRRRTRAAIEKQRKTYQRNKRRRQAAALNRNRKARGGRLTRVPAGQGYVDRMLAAMAPGEWYGRLDLVRMIGADRPVRGKVNQVMVRKGWVERARNPAWRGVQSPQKIFAGAVPEPQWVYRLTALGEARRAMLALLG
jgi:hypothetical protein